MRFSRRSVAYGCTRLQNILYALGAALGGPLGGWLGDTIGWKWACKVPCRQFGTSAEDPYSSHSNPILCPSLSRHPLQSQYSFWVSRFARADSRLTLDT